MLPVDLIALSAAALTGLLGSVHCLAMCGGIATGLSATAARPSLAWALQLNLGRVAGYTLAGAIVGGFGAGLLQLARIDGLAAKLRLAMGAVLLLAAARLLWPQRFGLIARTNARLWALLRPLQARLVPDAGPLRPWLLGAFWGWLPCGLSTTLLAAAWLEASALHGGLLMAAFGSGTLVAMVPVTWSGARLAQRLRQPRWRYGTAGLIAAAGLLTLTAPWLAQQPALHGALQALGCRSL